jgi:hypothetical protein
MEIIMYHLTARHAMQFVLYVACLGLAGPASTAAEHQQLVDRNKAASCISTRMASHELPAQRGFWQHSVYVTNRCEQPLNLKVCYVFTNDCIRLTAPPGQETMHDLGIRNQPTFQFTVNAD